MIELLAAPLAACLVLTGIHCYLGIHVIKRGVIFVDLALAQIAALGSVSALLLGFEFQSPQAYWASLGFTLVGALVIALGRFRHNRIPQEAFIGIVYVLGSALSILVLDRAPHGHEAIKHMLVGSILYASWWDVFKMAMIYGGVGLLHYLWRKPFWTITTNHQKSATNQTRIIFWDFLFYATFGVVVTSSVQIAGVLLVFAYLVIPAVSAMLVVSKIQMRLFLGWLLGLLGSLGGLAISAAFDLPTGASVVTFFGLIFMTCLTYVNLFRKSNKKCNI